MKKNLSFGDGIAVGICGAWVTSRPSTMPLNAGRQTSRSNMRGAAGFLPTRRASQRNPLKIPEGQLLSSMPGGGRRRRSSTSFRNDSGMKAMEGSKAHVEHIQVGARRKSSTTPLGRALERGRQRQSAESLHAFPSGMKMRDAAGIEVEAEEIGDRLPSIHRGGTHTYSSSGSNMPAGTRTLINQTRDSEIGSQNRNKMSFMGLEPLWLEPDGDASLFRGSLKGAAEQQFKTIPNPLQHAKQVLAGFTEKTPSGPVKMEMELEELAPLVRLPETATSNKVRHAAAAVYASPTLGVVQVVLVGTENGLFIHCPIDDSGSLPTSCVGVSGQGDDRRPSATFAHPHWGENQAGRRADRRPSATFAHPHWGENQAGRRAGAAGGGTVHHSIPFGRASSAESGSERRRSPNAQRWVHVGHDPCEWVHPIGRDGMAVSVLRAGTSGRPTVCLHNLSNLLEDAYTQQQPQQHRDRLGDMAAPSPSAPMQAVVQASEYASCSATESAFDEQGDFYLCIATEFRLVLLTWDPERSELMTLRDFTTPFREPPPAASALLFMPQHGPLPLFCVGCSRQASTRAKRLAVIDFNLLPVVAEAKMNPELGWVRIRIGWENVFAAAVEQLGRDTFALCYSNAVSFVKGDGSPADAEAEGRTLPKVIFSELPQSFVCVPGAILGVSSAGIEVRSVHSGDALGRVAGRFASAWPADLGAAMRSAASTLTMAAGGGSSRSAPVDWVRQFAQRSNLFSGNAPAGGTAHTLGVLATEVTMPRLSSHGGRGQQHHVPAPQAFISGHSAGGGGGGGGPPAVELHLVPTALVQMKIQDVPTSVDEMAPVRSMTFEVTKDTIETMLDGMGKILEQMESV
eukprot:gene731-24704_t